MVDPVSLTAGAIAQLAFSEFVKSGAGELAKKSIRGAIDAVKHLRDKIQAKFKGNDQATQAIAEVEQQGTEAALEKVTAYLDLEMVEDDAFASDIRQLAQQIINVQNQNTIDQRQYNNYGRDQINIDKIEGNPRISGS